MMGMLFEKVLNMSLVSCYIIAAVIIVRLFLQKCGRKYAYYLWFIVFLNLCVPFSLKGAFSLIPRQVAEFSITDIVNAVGQGQADIGDGSRDDAVSTGANPVNTVTHTENDINVMRNSTGNDTGTVPNNTLFVSGSSTAGNNIAGAVHSGTGGNIKNMTGVSVLPAVWIAGIGVFLLYNLNSIRKLKKQIKAGTRISFDKEERIAEVAGINAPFLWGFFHPVIYLPAGLSEEEKKYITAHENCHKKRGDHFVKIVVFLITIFHWFNPLVWLSYFLFCRDMEISCDEAVLSRADGRINKKYAESLLKYAARQNGYVMAPLTFGEPSVRFRIKNVLHYKKKGVVFSIIGIACVCCVVLGLAFRPAESGTDAMEENSTDTKAENGTGSPAETAPENLQALDSESYNVQDIVNNGSTVVEINGKLYYMDDMKLYSDGKYLYASDENIYPEEVRRYELDGSGYEKLFDGLIVDYNEKTNILYYMQDKLGNKTHRNGSLYAYNTQTGENICLLEDNSLSYLGRGAGSLYVLSRRENGSFIDSIRESDGACERDVLGRDIGETGQINSFYADENYILFSTVIYGGSIGVTESTFYSYNRTIGSFTEVHITDAPDFHVASGYVYYEKYANAGTGGSELYRANMDFDKEEQVGEGLTFLAFEEERGTLLAAKLTGENNYRSNLVRTALDGSNEQTLFDFSIICHEWMLEDYDKIRYTDLNRIGDSFYVKVEQWGYSEGNGYRDILLREQYFKINEGGAGHGYNKWNPYNNSEEWNYWEEDIVSFSCDPETYGWNLEKITDVRDTFSELPYIPEQGTEDDTLLLAQTENYTLYGKGDYEKMLLVKDGQYVEILYPYGSNYMIPVQIEEYDYDKDQTAELAVIFNVMHGTGVYVDTFLMADWDKKWGLTVYQFLDDNYLSQLGRHVSFDSDAEGMQAYVEGVEAGRKISGGTGEDAYDRVGIGNQIRFMPEGDNIVINADLEFYAGTSVVADYNGNTISATISYEDGGIFVLTDYTSRNPGLETKLQYALQDFYTGTYYGADGKAFSAERKKVTAVDVVEIRYDSSKMNDGKLEAVAVIRGEQDSYDYVNMELIREGPNTEDWVISDMLLEK